MGRRQRSRVGPALAAITLVHLGLLLTWSVMVPTFRGPDEHVHHDLIRHLTETWEYPDHDGLDVSRRTLDALGISRAFQADAPAVPASAAPHRADRPGWADVGPDVRNGPPNQMPQHPPLYYEAAGAALRVLDAEGAAPLDRTVWQLRLLNVVFMAPLPLLAADIARRYTRSGHVVLASAAGIIAVPQLTHIGATVSNDPLMILLGSLSLAGAVRVATGDGRWSVVVATGAFAGLALFTKGFAVPLVPAVALAFVLPLLARRADGRRAERGPVLARAGVVAVVALATGGWWWIRNVVIYGTPQPGVRLRDRVPGVDVDLLDFAGDFSDRLIASFWGDIGWFEVRLPFGVSVAMTVLVIVTVTAAVWRSWPRAVLVVPSIAASAMVLSAAWGAYKKTGVSYATQGRYLFTGITGLTVLVALGVARLLRRPSPWIAPATLAAALALQATALWVSLHRYWAGGSLVDRLRAMVAFAPVPGAVTTGTVAVTAVVSVGSLTLLLAGRRVPDGAPGPTQ